MKMLVMFLTVTLAYTAIYVGYTWAAKAMPSRVFYVAASVVGTIIGSTLGNRWFS